LERETSELYQVTNTTTLLTARLAHPAARPEHATTPLEHGATGLEHVTGKAEHEMSE